jgi:hypothetical protein
LFCIQQSDQEYSARAAHGVIAQLIESFQERKEDWSSKSTDYSVNFNANLKSLLKKYQSPDEMDRLNKIEDEIHSTKKIA